jgi:chemotaxis protein methyltransferase CheR
MILDDREQINDAQLARYADLIYRRTGIRLSSQKKMLLTNRLRRRLRDTKVASFDDYYDLLLRLKADHAEWDAFLQEITTHETYLFRDEIHWNWFRAKFLPEIIGESRQGKRPNRLRIWSAASSTGDEAATIATCVAAGLPNPTLWKVQIVGTDIGIGAVEQARKAAFGERAMKLVPDDLVRRFFTKDSHASLWHAKPALTDMMKFRQHNLLDRLDEEAFDLVVLKNVLIYFDGASKQTVINQVREKIRPGGYLLAGAAEGVSDMVRGMERLESWLFRNPPQA